MFFKEREFFFSLLILPEEASVEGSWEAVVVAAVVVVGIAEGPRIRSFEVLPGKRDIPLLCSDVGGSVFVVATPAEPEEVRYSWAGHLRRVWQCPSS